MKHTPGLWVVVKEADEHYTVELRGMDYIVVRLDRHKDSNSQYRERAEADARLIAAAPDLLRACKMVVEMAVAWQPLTPGDIEEVRAAIAKAEGEG